VAALATNLLLGACSVVGVRTGTPEPEAEIVDRVGAVQIRRYGPMLAAETTLEGSEAETRSAGFRLLAGYIFGRNARRKRIAMTAPVAQAASERSWTIRFYLPAGMTEASAPQPLDPRVVLAPIPARTFAVLRFAGRPTPASVEAHAAKLDAALTGGRWHADGPIVAWFYNPPWTLPPFRRSEVARPVHRD